MELHPIEGKTIHENDSEGEIFNCPYEFTFPSTALCCIPSGGSQLPPSLNIKDSRTSIKCEYTIIFAIQRRVLGTAYTVTSLEKELLLYCDPPIFYGPSSRISVVPVKPPLMPHAPRFGGGLAEPSLNMQVELVLPEPPILTLGQPIPVRLVLYRLPQLPWRNQIYVREVMVYLQSTATTTIGGSPRHVSETCPLWAMSGSVLVDRDTFEIDSGVWGSGLTARPPPTCQSCVVGLKHAIVAVAGISYGLGPSIQVWCFLFSAVE